MGLYQDVGLRSSGTASMGETAIGGGDMSWAGSILLGKRANTVYTVERSMVIFRTILTDRSWTSATAPQRLCSGFDIEPASCPGFASFVADSILYLYNRMPSEHHHTKAKQIPIRARERIIDLVALLGYHAPRLVFVRQDLVILSSNWLNLTAYFLAATALLCCAAAGASGTLTSSNSS